MFSLGFGGNGWYFGFYERIKNNLEQGASSVLLSSLLL